MRLAFKFGFVGGLGVQLRGGEGGEAPFTPSGRPAVSGAALSAPTRTGRCKKIAVSQKVFGKFLVPYVPRYSQFSCASARAEALKAALGTAGHPLR